MLLIKLIFTPSPKSMTISNLKRSLVFPLPRMRYQSRVPPKENLKANKFPKALKTVFKKED
jgi:hypothetical protein